MTYRSTALLFASTAILAIAAPAFAAAQVAAQVAAQSASDTQLDTVVVTARKTSEDSLKIPVSVTAFSAKALETRGVTSLSDLSNFTPGMTDQQTAYSGARSDRSFQAIIIRGMTPSAPGNPTTSIFINGTPISSPDMLTTLADIDHVEVLKGPQSAYFGRQTFAGAVNVVTTTAPNTLKGDLTLGVATRNGRNFHGDIGGPIIEDKLMISVGGNFVAHDGSYKNAYNPSETLGDQSTKSIHVDVTIKPVDHLTIKAYGLWMQDRDGPSATGLLLATNTNGYGQGNCTVAGVSYFCGALPNLTSASPSQIDKLSAAQTAFLNSGNVGGIIRSSDVIRKFGLKRDAYHNDLTAQYDYVPLGLTFTYLGAYNQEQYSEMSDLSNIDGAAGGQYPGYTGFPFLIEGTSRDVSNEFRINTNVNKPYRLMVGVSSVDQHGNSALGAPSALLAHSGGTESITDGIFFSAAYDILPQLTVNFDGRYQSDEERTYVSSGVLGLAGKSYAFLPRVSAQYRFTPDIMAYATYSQGVNPGVFNATLATLPAQTIAAIRAAGYNLQTAVQPEKITNYELGFKGRFLNGRATLTADVYYDKWKNQIDAETYNFSPTDANSPYNLVGSTQYNPSINSVYAVNFSDNGAQSTYKGVELDGNLIPIDHLTLNASAAYNDAKYDS
jgi:iron complex outermembrane receptor protein